MDKIKKAVILGAGISGLSSAYYLQKLGYEIIILEKESFNGGLSATLQYNDFYLDLGPHAFHYKQPFFIIDLINSLVRKEHIIQTKRDEMLFLFNKFFHYPLQFYELIFKFNPIKTLQIGVDYIIANIIYSYIAVPDDNFESWCIKRFGKTLYKILFGNYTKKVWGIEPRYISSKFAEQKIKKLKFKDIIYKVLGGKGQEHEIYWEDLIYFKYGSGELIDGFIYELRKQNKTSIINNVQIKKLLFSNNKIEKIIYYKDNQQYKIENIDLVISTIPFTDLLFYIDNNNLNKFFSIFSNFITYRHLILLYLFFDKEKILQNHWLYLSDNKFVFNRISEQKNMSSYVAPTNRTFLIFEKTSDDKSDIWKRKDQEIIKDALNDLKRIFPQNLSPIDYKVIKIYNAYPLYNLDYDKNMKFIFHYLSSFKNLYITGRQGLFLQNDMFDNILLSSKLSDFIRKEAPAIDWYENIRS